MNPVKDETIPLERMADLCRDLLVKSRQLVSDEDFTKETDTAKIIAFDFVQMSETFNRLSPEIKKKFRTVNEATIKGMRNVLVHDYGRIEGIIVRRTLEKDIDPLLQETLQLVEELRKANKKADF
jgi:Uncharacterized conserved protein